MRPEVANRRIASFGKRFGDAHLYLAYHAALPLALTPELLYRLWANFQRDIDGVVLNIPWIAVADLLLSNLCDEVGYELYEMDGTVRNVLLEQLKTNLRFGSQRIQEVSNFLLTYVRQQLDSHDLDTRDFAQAQRWTALAYVQPGEAARELALSLSRVYQQDRTELIRIASVVETLAELLTEFEPLVIYARGMANFARGDLEGAVAQFDRFAGQNCQIQVAGVNLLIPEQITEKVRGVQVPPTTKSHKSDKQNSKTSIINRFGNLFTWQLPSTETSFTEQEIRAHRTSLSRYSLYTLLISVGVTTLIMGVRFLGILQPLELKAFDLLMRTRPAETPDSRLLVVTVTAEDIQSQKQDLRPETSLSDRSLSRLLEKLESYQARAIGLDIYRDFPVEAGYQELAKRMKESARFFSVCKVSTSMNDPGTSPPPEVSAERLGFSDVVIDPDFVLRRHLLYMTPAPSSPCVARYALSAQLAFRYLATEKKKIVPKITSDGYIQLGNTVFKRLQAHTGGYQNIDASGYQVLLNYRAYRSIQDFVPQVTLAQVLNGQLNPNAVKDKIVLINVTAPGLNDYFPTPYSTTHNIPGVVAQAQMVSQILSAVLDHRPLLWVWPGWGEALWIWGWSLIGGILVGQFRSLLYLGLAGGSALGTLYGVCFGLFTQGGWVPLIPSASALVTTSAIVVIYNTAFQIQRTSKINQLPSSLETQSYRQ